MNPSDIPNELLNATATRAETPVSTPAPASAAGADKPADPSAPDQGQGNGSADKAYCPWPTTATLRSEIDCTLAYQVDGPTDCLFQIHALRGMDQQVLSESLEVSPPLPLHVFDDPNLGHRFTRLRVDGGEFTLRYRATVERTVEGFDPQARLVPIAELPDGLLHNLMPTRYCESDVLGRTAMKLFGDVAPGAAQVVAIVDWIHRNIEYRIGSTQSTSTAQDVYIQRAGVCRDFAHLAVTFCRALNIPARLVAGYAPFDAPPPDFHAVFEAYVGDRWVVFDPTRMSPPEKLVRIASGRDAKDVAFATLFGPARMLSMAPEIRPAA